MNAMLSEARAKVGHRLAMHLRVDLEPRRLFWRYLTTNPRALYLLLNRSRSTDICGTHNR